MNDIEIRTAQPGEPSLVCNFYYHLFADEYNFNGSVEGYFIKGMGELFDDPGGSRLWVAVQNDQIVGCIGVIKRGKHKAQIRWFGVDIHLQGKGLGQRLLNTVIDFCKKQGYTDLDIWTINILKSARHLYDKLGFVMTKIKPNHTWCDHELTEELWEYHEKQNMRR